MWATRFEYVLHDELQFKLHTSIMHTRRLERGSKNEYAFCKSEY